MKTVEFTASLLAVLWLSYYVHRIGGQIMATLAELNATLDSVAAGVDSLEKSIADLKVQVGNGGVVSQADLDALQAKAAAIVTDIADTSDQG